MAGLISHQICQAGAPVPAFQGPLYEYLLGGNGVFLRGQREGLDACLPLAWAEVRGLAPITPGVRLAYPPVPAGAVAKMLELARGAQGPDGASIEILFHLEWQSAVERWHLIQPLQAGGRTHVLPLDTGSGSSYARAIIEVHSHHTMAAFWSSTDDRDEQGFRLYAVLGDIFRRPTLRVRVGLYGYFLELPPTQVFDLPPGVQGPARRAAGRPPIREGVFV